MARLEELANWRQHGRTGWGATASRATCAARSARRLLGTLFFITWGEQPLMDAMADFALGGVPTQGFYVLAPQEAGALVPLARAAALRARSAPGRAAATGLGGPTRRDHLRRVR